MLFFCNLVWDPYQARFTYHVIKEATGSRLNVLFLSSCGVNLLLCSYPKGNVLTLTTNAQHLQVTAYAAELEDLELEKKRLVSLWNSVLVNIQQRDRVYDSVRDDYR